MRMAVRRGWIEIAVIFLACIAFFAAGLLLDARAGSSEAEPVLQFDGSAVDTLAIDNKAGGFELVRQEDGWAVAGRADFAVDQNKTAQLIDTLQALPAARVLEKAGDAGLYGLDEPAHTILIQAGATSHTLEIGAYNAALASYYVRADGQIYLVQAPYLADFSYDALAYAAPVNTVALRNGNVSLISVTSGTQQFALRPYAVSSGELYTNRFEWVVDGYLDVPLGADSNVVYQMIDAVKSVEEGERAGYLDSEGQLADWHLDAPVMTVQYEYEATTYEGQRYDTSLTLRIGAGEDGLYANIEDDPVVYKVSDEVASLLAYLSQPTTYVNTRVCMIDPSEVTGMTISDGSKTYDISVSADACTVNGASADRETVQEIFSLVTDIQCYGFAKETGLTPTIEIEIRRNYPGYESMKMTFAKNGTDYYNVAFGPVKDYLINKNYVLNLQNLLKNL